MFNDEGELDSLIQGLRSGEQEAIVTFWNRYGPMLERLADRNLAQGMRRRFGPEDIVQSACRTFFRRAQAGEFEIPSEDSLWRLLCAITLTKLRQQARFHGRQRRDVRQEKHLDSVDLQGRPKVRQLANEAGDPEDAVEFADQMQALIGSLEEKERAVLELKLQEVPNEEIARRLGCAERTVRRRLERIEAILRRMLDEAR
ncbi:MAG: RNA polymerase sigma factor [Thermoguttaceae bacterium]